ncbi:uncharacterized protein LOC121810365 [Salvia splendens]|uniref:uncharacterized protein LOC121810365 n=1 Tax=Salvia splendens TaxID=180675 RepID=UPI001C258D2B|nr:uncharacterized protein LOC121810365 [Salvia splendens]
MASIRSDVCGSFESPIVISDDVLDERNRSIVNESSFDSSNLNEDGEFWDIGDPSYMCGKPTKPTNPRYSGCCMNGNIEIPKLTAPPDVLHQLMFSNDAKSSHYLKNIRSYNSMFGFTSMGGKVDNSVNTGGGPPVFRLYGQNYHLIGSLLPVDGCEPKFAQLYVYDTDDEINYRITSVRFYRQRDAVNNLHSEIVSDLQHMLDKENVLVKSFRMAKEKIGLENQPNVSLKLLGKRGRDGRTHNLPSVSEVAMLVVGDFDEALGDRDIVVVKKSGQLQRISELHPSYLPLQYPLLFPYGEDGYKEDIGFSRNSSSSSTHRKSISPKEFFAFRLHERISEYSILLFGRRLFQQFVVDAYTMIETGRLTFVRTHQKRLRAELYSGLAEAVLRGETDGSRHGKRIILPSSFVGGARYMVQNYQDAMAICRWIGYPNLFITFTCNPKWPEICRYLASKGLKSDDRPDIICRIFKVKLDNLIRDLKSKKIFGVVKAVVYTVEFQKRGLPHAHILLFLSNEDKHPKPQRIDEIISAELPDQATDPHYHEYVKEFMMHGPCGIVRKSSPCMLNGRCSKYFPKKYLAATNIDDDGYPAYRRRDNGRVVMKDGVPLDNRYVVPHNRFLLMKYGGHINVEWCNQSRSIKYLFKYINKGYDRVTTSFFQSGAGGTERCIDEVSLYYDCRYISSCEAAWRIFGFEIQYKDPPVERLSFHLPDQQHVVFDEADDLDTVLNRKTIHESKFLAWMEANKIYSQGRDLTYGEFPTKFVWKKNRWEPRKQRYSIGRLFYVAPGSGDMYYLRCLLNIVKGASSYEDIRCVNGVQYDTFRDACFALGLLDDDKEYVDGIVEASFWASAHSLRLLFVSLLTSESISRPDFVWQRCWKYLFEDVLYNRRKLTNNPGMILSEDEIQNVALAEIEKLLQNLGKTLRDFHGLPYPDSQYFESSENRLIADELCYDRECLAREYLESISKFTGEQLSVHDTIMSSVHSNYGGIFFVYGYGGTGKTFIWRSLSAGIRSKGDIILNVASSGIASLLLPGGRTAHSRFKIPINVNEDSMYNIKPGGALAELIVRAKLIIWDEAPMIHKHCIEAVDRTLRDIMRVCDELNRNKPFGGKTVVFGGDFRQILPVVPKGSRQDVVNATINSSYLWKSCTVLRLTKNMRLLNTENVHEASKLKEFSSWVASIGDGVIGGPNDGEVAIQLPIDIVLPNSGDPLRTIVSNVYPSYMNPEELISCLHGRAILAPTLEVVDEVNQFMISLDQSQGRVYFSSDSISNSDSTSNGLAEIHSVEFLNKLKCSGTPNHELLLKVGTPVMLLRNIDLSNGLCNGTRLIITRLGDYVLEGHVLGGHNIGHKVLIPRMSLIPSDPRLPFKFQRRQFPLAVSYAMTINKSQGQSLSHVGLFLRKPVFNHGQMYVAISRVTSREGLKIFVCKDEVDEGNGDTTVNIVYKEVFQNL